MGKNIPVYSINQFKKDSEKKLYQVEIFDKNRHFQVEYPHRHDNFYEILLIINGSGWYTIDFITYEIKPGNIYFVTPGQVHTIKFSEDVFGYIFLFTADFFLKNHSEKAKLSDFPFFQTHSNPPLNVESISEFEFIFELACKESLSDSSESDFIVRSALELILFLIKKHYPLPAIQAKGKGLYLFNRFKELVDDKFTIIHSVKEYASILSVTPSHLNETVKDISGKSAKDHIKDRQLLEIKRLLSHSDLNISEISDKMNFQDQSYFSRFFKKSVGMSPADFRNQLPK